MRIHDIALFVRQCRRAGTPALIAAVVGLLLAVDAQAAEKPDAAAAAKGQITYVRYCVACHGKAARGDGGLAGDLRVPVPDLTTLAARSGGQYPYDRVARIISSGEVLKGHGNADMPAWGDVFKKTKGIEAPSADAAIGNLAHYLWTLQRAKS